MKSRLLAGIAAFVLALVGAVLVFAYAQAAEARAVSGLEPKEVLVVQESVPEGTPVDQLASMVRSELLPTTAVAASALKNLDASGGMVTSVDLLPGEHLLAERLVTPETLSSAENIAIPENFHEVSFQLEPQRVVGATIAAGDTVGLFVSKDPEDEGSPQSTQLIIHKVLVTGVQGAPLSPKAEVDGEEVPSEAPPAPTGSLLVTVAVSEEQATRIVFAAEFARIWLSKEATTTEENSAPVTMFENELYR
ncbi:pilus assembly protein CpaB [Arthrobacter sp. CAN_A214]|uniref:Flp pilus assembly protein CpaB n=1 Tax=Arthrobacter sp. CAN_A214 TaxID=2787720 RepID=UPI0018C9089A